MSPEPEDAIMHAGGAERRKSIAQVAEELWQRSALAAGWVPPENVETIDCPRCYGKGKVHPMWQFEEVCSGCGGVGTLRIVKEAK